MIFTFLFFFLHVTEHCERKMPLKGALNVQLHGHSVHSVKYSHFDCCDTLSWCKSLHLVVDKYARQHYTPHYQVEETRINTHPDHQSPQETFL